MNAKENNNQKWIKWTIYEAGTKTLIKILQKVIGGASLTLAHTFLAAAIIGLTLSVTGYTACRLRSAKLIENRNNLLGSCLFGFFAVVTTVLSFTVFCHGGDLGVNTFIITLSIVPGALIDRFYFGHRLKPREWLGVAIAVFAGYAILDWPALAKIAKLPLWIWLSLATMLSVAINQGITQKIKKIDPWVNNFWGGLTMVSLCLIMLIVVNGYQTIFDFSLPARKLKISSLIMGLIIAGAWIFNLLSYKSGAKIAIKKLVMNGAHLVSAMVCGVIFFGEKISVGKVEGTLLYLIAFILIDKDAWSYFADWLKKQ